MFMQAGHNPTRRNRNIGTAKQGRGQDNRLVIPGACPKDRLFYEVLDDAVPITRTICDRDITFLVQPVTRGFVHACTVDDICRMLGLVPAADLTGIDLLVLRQPTRKQTLLRPCWGRLCYYADTGRHWGRAIFLEAQPPGQTLRWDRSMTPDDAAEFERLKADGHGIEEGRRAFAVIPNPDSIRATQLYRTLLHELGHHVDYMEKVSERARDEADYARRQAEYVARPRREREDFAHRYASELSARLREDGLIPYGRLVEAASMEKDGLDPAWFGVA
jgi:hypothetical protein